MKKLMLSALGTAALALAACGDGGHLQSMPRPEAPASNATPDEVAGHTYELRLRGENTTGLTAALMPVRGLRVTTPDGTVLPVRVKARTVDLTEPNQAHLVGQFFVPEGVERVKVQLALDDFGGWEGAGGGGAIDARGGTVSFEAPVDFLSQRGRAVVLLDMGRSLRPASDAEGSRKLVPQLSVNY